MTTDLNEELWRAATELLKRINSEGHICIGDEEVCELEKILGTLKPKVFFHDLKPGDEFRKGQWYIKTEDIRTELMSINAISEYGKAAYFSGSEEIFLE